jgi:hypothetical protein
VRRITAQAPQPTLYLPVIPPLSDQLTASFGFDQASYAPTDTTHLTITLTNTGETALIGVIADCNRDGDSNGLFSFDGWGPLSGNGPGATIPADSTVTFHVDQPMPEFAQSAGYVEARACSGPNRTDCPKSACPVVPPGPRCLV